MEEYLQFLMKASLVLVVLYTCFWVLVRKETFFQFNRGILISIILLSICLPLLPVSSWIGSLNLPYFSEKLVIVNWEFPTESPSVISSFDESIEVIPISEDAVFQRTDSPASVVEKPVIDYWEFIFIVYWMVFIIFFLRFLMHSIWVFNTIFRSQIIYHNGYTFILSEKKISPFSFFKFIFLNPQHLDDQEFNQIIKHEEVHASHYHSIDLLLAELISIFFWFNPVAWLLNRSIRQNLEYIVDTEVLKTGVPKKNYQYHLLRVSIPDFSSRLTNHFNHSLLKNRIAMMNVNQSSRRAKWKYCFFLPIVMGLFVLLNNTTQAQSTPPSKSGKPVESTTNSAKEVTTFSDEKGTYALARKKISSGSNYSVVTVPRKSNDSGIGVASQSISGDGIGIGRTTAQEAAGSAITLTSGEASVNSIAQGIGSNSASTISGTSPNEKDIILVVITAEFDQSQLDRLKKDLKKEQIDINYEDVAFNTQGKLSSIKVKIQTEDGSFNGSAMSYSNNDEPIEEPVIFYYLYDEEGKGKYHDIKTWGVVTGKESKYIPEDVKAHLDKVKNGYVIGKISFE